MQKNKIYSIILILLACNVSIKKENDCGRFPIKEFGKWGFINSNGKIVINCQFDEVGSFSEGLAPIRLDTLWGFIDSTGQIIIKPRFNSVSEFSNGLCFVKFKNGGKIQNAFIKPNGKTAFVTPYDNISLFAYEKAVVTINEEVCVIDKSGKIVFNTHFSYGGSSGFKDSILHVWNGYGDWVQEGDFQVWRGDSTKFFDLNGKVIAAFEGMGGGDFSDGVAQAYINDSSCYINNKGKVILKPLIPNLTLFGFSEGMAIAVDYNDMHKQGFIDKKGKLVIPTKFEDVRDFKQGLAAFKKDNVWGFIDKTGKVKIDPQFDYIEFSGFENGLCKISKNHKWGYVNLVGKIVWQEQIGLEYNKLDFYQYNLDTLNINKPLYSEKRAGNKNYPRRITFTPFFELTLSIDTIDQTVFEDKYYGYKLYLINASNDTTFIPAEDSRIEITQEAKDENGLWRDIDIFSHSFCGNSYHIFKLPPKSFQIFSTPIYKGTFRTELRFKLRLKKTYIYSNSYIGYINIEQIIRPRDYNPRGIYIGSSY